MHAQATYQSRLQAIEALAIAALPRWGLAGAAVRLVNDSENATYFVTAPGAVTPVVLRVHREDYHTVDGIRSELAWMRALEAEAGLKTPQAIPGMDGKDVQTRFLREHGIEIGGGLGPTAPPIWRVGLMGVNANRETADRVLVAFDAILPR